MFVNLFAIDFVLEKQKKKRKQHKSSMINLLTTIFSKTPTSNLDFAVQQQQKMSIYSLPALTIVAALLTWYFLASLQRSLLPSPPWKNNNTLTKNDLPRKEEEKSTAPANDIPISVNYHFTRQCNMSCGFCFHTATTSHMVSLEDALKGIRLLKDAGMRKINFAGGEPFLYPKILGKMVDFCKEVSFLLRFSFFSFSRRWKE